MKNYDAILVRVPRSQDARLKPLSRNGLRFFEECKDLRCLEVNSEALVEATKIGPLLLRAFRAGVNLKIWAAS